MAQAAQARKSDNVVIGTWRGGGTPPAPPPEAPDYYEAITPQEMTELQSKGLTYPGGVPRWEIAGGPGGTLTELADPRLIIGFFDAGTLDQVGAVTRVVGQAPPFSVACNAMIDDTTVNTAFDGDVDLLLSDGRWVRVSINNGIGSLSIDVSQAREWAIGASQEGWSMLNALQVRVIADGSV